MERNWTTGSIFKNIILFTIPYLFSVLLQTLYGIADLFIIGQFNSTDSITAVSIGSQIMHMLTVSIAGLAVGPTIAIGKAIGAHEREKTGVAIGNSVSLFMSGSLLLMILLLFLVSPIIRVMSTPVEAVSGATSYLKICFIGIPFITAYNLISAVFRGLGDSKTPMYFIIVAFICNIGFDYLFIGAFHMGPVGAALGTTLAQVISVLSALWVILKKETGICLGRHDFIPQKNVVKIIFKIGVPVFLQNSFIQISFLAITIFVNMRGLYDAAAVGIVEKIIGIMFLVPSSMLATVSTLAAQNIGAGKQDRAKKTLWDSILVCVIFGVLTSIITVIYAPQIVGLFEDNETVILLGSQYIRTYVWDCIFAGTHFCFSGYFCAMERSELSFLHNFFSIILIRIPFSFLAARPFFKTLYPLGMVTVTGSIFSILFCVVAYSMIQRKRRKNKEKETRL